MSVDNVADVRFRVNVMVSGLAAQVLLFVGSLMPWATFPGAQGSGFRPWGGLPGIVPTGGLTLALGLTLAAAVSTMLRPAWLPAAVASSASVLTLVLQVRLWAALGEHNDLEPAAGLYLSVAACAVVAASFAPIAWHGLARGRGPLADLTT
ncbi:MULTISPECIES: hypothetical protein [Thermomonosporaceae]|uniref:hypothetical protein n=1 Tax=Thermomonosporaceae TaxID=2012 RepID=UPI00255B327A|nr:MULTISPECIES: hypothetical protein [Thermomonosporaceae]MDL4777549.1 hypothetical protein [Actinomadura xylanilytica]